MRKRSTRTKGGSAAPRKPGDGLVVAIHNPEQTLPAEWLVDDYTRWFFGFLRADLSALSADKLLGMRANLEAFVRPEIVNLDTTFVKVGGSPVETKRMLEELQSDARLGIERVRNGDWFELKEGVAYGIARIGRRIIKGSKRGSFDDLFRAAVMDVVQEAWEQLFDCPHCGQLFLKIGKQKYCSPRCANQVHWSAFKTRRAERNYHDEHVRRVRKKLGSKVRVAVKPRRRT